MAAIGPIAVLTTLDYCQLLQAASLVMICMSHIRYEPYNMLTSSARLTYRKPEVSDFDRLFEIYSDPQTQRFNPAGPMETNAQAKALVSTWIKHWATHGFGWWAIAEKASPEHLIGFGGVGYYSYLSDLRLNLGYRFASEVWGRGYATETGQFALSFAFTTHGLEHIWAIVRPGHTASIKVLEKVGMHRCGELDDVPGEPSSLIYEIQSAWTGSSGA